ncbi:MAG: DUF2306 domain-containing protein [Actinomycetota bacterium]
MTTRLVTLRTVAFAVFALAATLYAVTSIEYFAGYEGKEQTLWDRVFSGPTSERFATGPGSVRAEMHEVYSANRIALQLHATTGAIMLVTGIFQFWTPLRRARPRLHRLLGRLYVALAIPTSGGALVYLASVPPDEVFSGQVFTVALFGLAVATALSTYMAYRTARHRQFEAHRAWMLQSYFYILSAPLLRLVWVGVYQVDDGLDQWDNNLYAVALTTALIAFAPLVFFGFSARGGTSPEPARRADLPSLVPTWLRTPTVRTAAIAIAGVAAGAGVLLPVDTPYGPALPSSALTAGLMLAFAVAMRWHHDRHHRSTLTEAWDLMVVALLAAPVTTAVAALAILAIGWPLASAVPGGALAAFFVNPLVAYGVFIHQRLGSRPASVNRDRPTETAAMAGS